VLGPFEALPCYIHTYIHTYIPHPPYSPDLASCDFALFPKLKMKPKERCFETMSDIQMELQLVLNSIKENDFHGASEPRKK
jgi:hypothetical protein